MTICWNWRTQKLGKCIKAGKCEACRWRETHVCLCLVCLFASDFTPQLLALKPCKGNNSWWHRGSGWNHKHTGGLHWCKLHPSHPSFLQSHSLWQLRQRTSLVSANSMDKRTSHRLSVLCNFQKQPAEWAKKSPSTTASLGALHQLLFLAITCIAMHCYALLCYRHDSWNFFDIFRLHSSRAPRSEFYSGSIYNARALQLCSRLTCLKVRTHVDCMILYVLYVCIICIIYMCVCVFTLSVCICPVFFVVLICMV